MKKIVYMMRHGQTLFNVQHKNQGWCDSPLTALGKEQAEIAKKYFKDNKVKFDAAYCSTSERAVDTLELITDMPYTRLKGLKEWNFGAYEAKDSFLNPPSPFGDFFKNYGGEGQTEFVDRIVSTMTNIMEKETGTVLVVSHGAACARFTHYFDDYNEVIAHKGLKNCAIFKYEYEKGIFRLLDLIEYDYDKEKKEWIRYFPNK